MSVLIDFANFGLFHSIDFAISTRTPVHAILTSLQTSYRLLARRGSQVVSIEQGAIFPEHLAGHTWPAQAHHPEWKDATSSVGRSREYFAGSLSAARCFEAAGRGSTICNVDNLPLVAQQADDALFSCPEAFQLGRGLLPTYQCLRGRSDPICKQPPAIADSSPQEPAAQNCENGEGQIRSGEGAVDIEVQPPNPARIASFCQGRP